MSTPGYDVKDRVRSIDVNKLDATQADQLGDQIGEKLRHMVDKTITEANAFLKIYGIQVKMQFALEPLEKESPKGE